MALCHRFTVIYCCVIAICLSASNLAVASICMPQIITMHMGHENGKPLDILVLSSSVSSTLSQLSPMLGTQVMAVNKILAVQYKSLAESKQVFAEHFPDVFSIDKFFRLRVFVDGQDTHEILQLLELVGILDRNRFAGVRNWHSFEIYFLWPGENATVQDMRSSIRESLDSAEFWPTMSSMVYLVLAAPHSEKCLVHEFYSILNDTDEFILNPVTTGGNYIRSRTNFQGTPLKVSAAAVNITEFEGLNLESGLKMSQQEMSNRLTSKGVCVDVLHYLQQIFNFSILVVPTDRFIQLPPDNVTWTGLGKLLMDRAIDLSIDQSLHISYRAQYFTLLLPVFTDRVNIYFRQPSVTSNCGIFLMPFSPEIWTAIVVQFFIYLGLLLVLKQVTGNNIDLGILTKNNFLLLTSFLTNQGWHRQPRKTWARVIFFVGSATGLILSSAYSAKLVSLFAMPATKLIETVDGFEETPRKVFASTSSTYWDAIFHGYLPGGHAKQLEVVNIADAVNSVLVEPATFSPAVVSFSYNFYPETTKLWNDDNLADRKRFCEEMTEIPVLQSSFSFGMLIPKNSPLKEFFNSQIIQAHESGLLSRTQTYYSNSYRPVCDQNTPAQTFLEDIGLGFDDIYSAFLVLLFGVSIAVAVLIYETLLSWASKRLRNLCPKNSSSSYYAGTERSIEWIRE